MMASSMPTIVSTARSGKRVCAIHKMRCQDRSARHCTSTSAPGAGSATSTTVHNSDRRREARKKIFKSDRSEGAAVTMIGGCTLGIGALPAPVAARRKCTREEARDGGQRPIASTVQKLPTLAMSCWR